MSISISVFFISLICKIKKPPGTIIGFVKSLTFKPFIANLIFLLSEFLFIQSNLPPILAVGDTLYLSAAKSKPFSLIVLLIS